jgi:hypothetical protein
VAARLLYRGAGIRESIRKLTQPSATMLAAHDADPELASVRLDFTATIREVLDVMSAGLLARGASR